MRFASDNTSGAHPALVEAIAAEAQRVDAPYGDDEQTGALDARLSEVFERSVRTFPVVTGTAANALSLATISPTYGSIACTPVAHALVDECGAVEHLSGGARLVPVDHDLGRMRVDALAAVLDRLGHGVHAMPHTAVTLTQQTELGTAYGLDEVRALTDLARGHGLRTHLDGARLANALVHLGCSPADATWRAGIDVLSLGATKDGAIGAEVIVLFDPDLALDLEYRRKRAGHLLSKLRFVSAQLHAWLADDLWLDLARHANAQARRLADGIAASGVPGVSLLCDPHGNEVFVHLPPDVEAHLVVRGAQLADFDVDGERLIRFVASWSTTDEDVDELLAALADAPR